MNMNMIKSVWNETNAFFTYESEYNKFTDAMKQAAETGILPLALQHDTPESVTSNDIKWLSQRFKQDTGLSLTAEFHNCQNCGKRHCVVIVDY